MKWFGRKSARDAARLPLSRAGMMAGFGEWPRSYEAQVREGYCQNPVAQRAVRLVAEGVGGAALTGSDPALVALVTARSGGQVLTETVAAQLLLHNEGLALLDLAVQARVLSAGANMPPTDPVPGDAWILGEAPEGVWAGHAHEVAGWTEGDWRFLAPFEGMRSWISGDRAFGLFSEGQWTFGRSYGRLIVDGQQVVGPRISAIAEPAGGTTVDAEARAAVIAVLEALRGHGLIDTI